MRPYKQEEVCPSVNIALLPAAFVAAFLSDASDSAGACTHTHTPTPTHTHMHTHAHTHTPHTHRV